MDAKKLLAELNRKEFADKYGELHWAGSFIEYLNMVIERPAVARTAFQRMYDMIDSYGYDKYIEYKKEIHKKGMDSIIIRIQKYIRYHINEELTLTGLAEQVYLNPSYLSRIYKQLTGLNLFDYVNQVRIDKAKELLKESNKKIQEIAAAVGLDSAPTFTRFFKRMTNMTPQEYRES